MLQSPSKLIIDHVYICPTGLERRRIGPVICSLRAGDVFRPQHAIGEKHDQAYAHLHKLPPRGGALEGCTGRAAQPVIACEDDPLTMKSSVPATLEMLPNRPCDSP